MPIRSQLLLQPTRHKVRLVPQRLRDGESLSSLVDHQAQLWGVGRRVLALQVSLIPGMLALRDLDGCRHDQFLREYAQLCGCELRELQAACADDPVVLIGQRARHAYCPLCFQEDLARGEVPYFRIDWARMLLTHCRSHRCPLFRWRACTLEGVRKIPHPWFMGQKLSDMELLWFKDDLNKATAYSRGILPRVKDSRTIWKNLISFETQLYKKGVASPWYRASDRTRLSTEIMKYAVSLIRPVDGNPENSLIKSIQPEYEDHDVMSFTLRRHRDRTLSPSWRELRNALTSLPCRRAVLSVVAQKFLREVALGFRIDQAEGAQLDMGHAFGTQAATS